MPEEFDAPLTGAGQVDRAALMEQYNNAAYENWDKSVLEPCPHCNRTF